MLVTSFANLPNMYDRLIVARMLAPALESKGCYHQQLQHLLRAQLEAVQHLQTQALSLRTMLNTLMQLIEEHLPAIYAHATAQAQSHWVFNSQPILRSTACHRVVSSTVHLRVGATWPFPAASGTPPGRRRRTQGHVSLSCRSCGNRVSAQCADRVCWACCSSPCCPQHRTNTDCSQHVRVPPPPPPPQRVTMQSPQNACAPDPGSICSDVGVLPPPPPVPTWRTASRAANVGRGRLGQIWQAASENARPPVQCRKRQRRSEVRGGSDASPVFRLVSMNCNRLWSRSGRLCDSFHEFAQFLAARD